MHRLTQLTLLLVISTFLLAANPFQEPPPATPTPAPLETCLTEGFPECIPGIFREYGFIMVLLLVVFALAWVIIKAEGQNWLEAYKSWRKKDPQEWLNKREINEFTKQYLSEVRKSFNRIRFRGLPKHRETFVPPALSQVFISLNIVPTSKAAEDKTGEKNDTETGIETRLAKESAKPVSLAEAFTTSPKLALVGIAGSGKSTLLQWAGLCATNALLRDVQLTDEQAEFLKSLGLTKTPIPIYISLNTFDNHCIHKDVSPSPQAILDFLRDNIKKHTNECPDNFFDEILRGECLLMLDGVDEVAPKRRDNVIKAVENFISKYDSKNLRCFITSRPTAAYLITQMADFQRCDIQRISKPQREHLVRIWYQAVYAEDHAKAQSKADDLCKQIAVCEEPILKLATTPLMVTIFAVVHDSRTVLPKQRAFFYEDAVDILLSGVEYKDEYDSVIAQSEGWDTKFLKDRLSHIAFTLMERKLESMLEADLVDLIWPRFGIAKEEASHIACRFIQAVASQDALLEKVDDRYGFYSHTTFREFLAGRYLASGFATTKMQRKFLEEHLEDDQWEEPIRLAVGFSAISGEETTDRLVNLLAGLGDSEGKRSQALALAGFAFADLPKGRRLPGTEQNMLRKLEKALGENPPIVQPIHRRRLGLALGELGDPRLDPLKPKMVTIPAGPFRMGTSEEDKQLLEAQKSRSWPDEQPDHILELPEFQIGKYPLTNAEFRLFWQQKGYAEQELWSTEGWKWRSESWESDLSGYSEETQKYIRNWLTQRPPDRRDRPFYWDDPHWSGNNLLVVGVCWFEAQAYCRWLSRETGLSYRLPSEAEWEKAARGPNGLLWPWGNEWDAEKCNCADSNDAFRGTTPVGMYPDGNSLNTALDMVGNIWEWTSSLFKDYPYQARDGRENPANPGSRVVRGGSWGSNRSFARCAYRGGYVPGYFDFNIGFRLVLSPK